jgi:hypothetical protein
MLLFNHHFFLAQKTGAQTIHRPFLPHPSWNAEIPEKLPSPATVSVILGVELKEGLRVRAGGAFDGGFNGLYHPAAFPAFPKGFVGLLEEAFVLQRLGQLIVPSFVPFLDGGDLLERLCDILEAFLQGIFSKAPVESGPIVSFTGRSRFEMSQSVPVNARRVACSDRHLASLEVFEKKLGMLFLLIRGFQKKAADLLKTLLSSNACCEGIAVSSLRLARKSCKQILFGL